MQSTVLSRADDPGAASAASHGRSAASRGAIVAGAFVAVSASLILLSLGAGFEFASISPWAGHGISAMTFTVTSAIWFIVTQWISACLGGYIAGRLRTRWVGTHPHEVFFREAGLTLPPKWHRELRAALPPLPETRPLPTISTNCFGHPPRRQPKRPMGERKQGISSPMH